MYVLCGGICFTLLLTVFFGFVVEKYKAIYAYPVVFFNFIFRLFPQIMKFDFQDEARISALLEMGKYTITIIVLIPLLLITWRASHVLKLNYKDNIVCVIASIICTFLVVFTDILIFHSHLLKQT